MPRSNTGSLGGSDLRRPRKVEITAWPTVLYHMSTLGMYITLGLCRRTSVKSWTIAASEDYELLAKATRGNIQHNTLVESLSNVGRSKDCTWSPSKWFNKAAARYCWPIPGRPLISRRGRKMRERSNSGIKISHKPTEIWEDRTLLHSFGLHASVIFSIFKLSLLQSGQ